VCVCVCVCVCVRERERERERGCSAEDLDQLIAAHKGYIDRILERALLTEAYEPARRQVNIVLFYIILYHI
jgi:hypothetical protein